MSERNPTTLMSIPSEDSFDFLFKIVLIGDCGTGKTSIVQRFKTGNYVERHGNTIGVDFSMKTILVDGKKVKVRKLYLLIIKNCSFKILDSNVWIASNLGHSRTGTL